MKCTAKKISMLILILVILFSVRTIALAENSSLAPLEISSIYEDDQTISGTGNPGAEIKIEFPNGQIVDTIVESDGSWQISIPAEVTLTPNLQVSVTQTVNLDPAATVQIENLDRNSQMARVGDTLQFTATIWHDVQDTVLKDVRFSHSISNQVEFKPDEFSFSNNGIPLTLVYTLEANTNLLTVEIDSLADTDNYTLIYCVKVTTGFNTTITGSAYIEAAPITSNLTATVLSRIPDSTESEELEYEISYRFISATKGRDLPQEILVLLPQSQPNVADNTVVTPPLLLQTEVKTTDGTWTFKNWNKESAVIDHADVEFVGTWAFTEDEADTVDTTGAPDTSAPSDTTAAAKEITKKTPPTGDAAMVLLYAVTLFASFTTILYFNLKRRRGQ